MKVRVLPEAREQAQCAGQWWRANRPAAPSLFEDELAVAIERVGGAPASGTPYPHPKVPGVRRLLLRATRYHLYYLHDAENDEVLVLSVWSALRGRGPALGPPSP